MAARRAVDSRYALCKSGLAVVAADHRLQRHKWGRPSGQRRKDRLVGPISWQTPFQQSAMEHRAGCEEGQREHQTEGLERKPKEIDLRLHAERLEVTERVGHLTIDAHLKVEVITEAKTGTTDVADYLTLADVLPNRGGKPGLVGVAGGKR